MYFTEEEDVSTKDNVKQWVEWMKTPETKAYLLFLDEALQIFTNFNLKFQSIDVKIHQLYDEQQALHNVLLVYFVKPEIVEGMKDISERTKIDVNRLRNQLPPEDVVISAKAQAAISDLPKDRQRKFILRCRDFYTTAVMEVGEVQ